LTMLSRQRPFAEAWHDYRRRRYLVWFSWGLFLALAVGLPALSRYVQSDVPLVVAGAAAMTLMCASRIYATLFRCPRCGSFFHVSLFPGFPGNDSRGGPLSAVHAHIVGRQYLLWRTERFQRSCV